MATKFFFKKKSFFPCSLVFIAVFLIVVAICNLKEGVVTLRVSHDLLIEGGVINDFLNSRSHSFCLSLLHMFSLPIYLSSNVSEQLYGTKLQYKHIVNEPYTVLDVPKTISINTDSIGN